MKQAFDSGQLGFTGLQVLRYSWYKVTNIRKIRHTLANYLVLVLLLIISSLHELIIEKVLLLYAIELPDNPKRSGSPAMALASVFVAPILETLLFQYLPHKWLKYISGLSRNTKLFEFLYILLSALAFSFSHYYAYIYMLFMLFPGLLLGYAFNFFYRQNNSYSNAMYFILLLYVSKNTLAFVFNNF
jgi:hypothetical protein